MGWRGPFPGKFLVLGSQKLFAKACYCPPPSSAPATRLERHSFGKSPGVLLLYFSLCLPAQKLGSDGGSSFTLPGLALALSSQQMGDERDGEMWQCCLQAGGPCESLQGREEGTTPPPCKAPPPLPAGLRSVSRGSENYFTERQ